MTDAQGPATARIGKIIMGRYRIERRLSNTDVVEAYEARDLQVWRRLAIEFLQHRAEDEELFSSLQQSSGLQGESILQVIDYGVTEDGAPFLVTEFFEAESLGDLIRRCGILPVPRAVSIIMQACDGLSEAHRNGIVHGGLEPARLLIGRQSDGSDLVKIGGFEMRVLRDGDKLTGAGARMGSPLYLSPEQARGAEVIDGRTDIYALGAILYELLSGAKPYSGDNDFAILYKVVCEMATPLDCLRPGLPTGLVEVVTRAMAKDPDSRFASTADLEAALRPFAEPTYAAAGAAAPASTDAPVAAVPPHPVYVDENVQFSVYRPRAIAAGRWYPMLAFAHLSEARDGDENQDPLGEVVRQAQQSLGEQLESYQDIKADSAQAVPREGELTFVPRMPGVTFNPPSRTFLWLESVHKEEFRLRADASLDGQMARGHLTVYLGTIILADILLSIRVGTSQAARPEMQPAHARPYRSIFASYSHQDGAIVTEFERYVETLGDRYLRDCRSLRSGERWSEGLGKLIEQADVFQLFWSSHSMRSPFVNQEWQHALALRRSQFVRPVYWEEPFPETADGSLPPAELRQLHFQKITFAREPGTTVATESPTDLPKTLQEAPRTTMSRARVTEASYSVNDEIDNRSAPARGSRRWPALTALGAAAMVLLVGVVGGSLVGSRPPMSSPEVGKTAPPPRPLPSHPSVFEPMPPVIESIESMPSGACVCRVNPQEFLGNTPLRIRPGLLEEATPALLIEHSGYESQVVALPLGHGPIVMRRLSPGERTVELGCCKSRRLQTDPSHGP